MTVPSDVPPGNAPSDRPLLAILLSHQRRDWRRGERPEIEDYLRAQPDLASDAEAVLDLIYNEVLLREEVGESPRPEDYAGRFPDLATPLAIQFEVERAIGPGPKGLAGGSHGVDSTRNPSASPRPVVLPGYEILGEVGRGGMGVVYKARHVRLNRMVALKMILAAEHAGAEVYTRFLAEAEAVARLQHPNIVQIFAFDAHDGHPFIEMEFAEGGSLADRLSGPPWSAHAAARLVESLARAVHEVHRVGIVHRDLKPANVLLTADGTPKIADFGLAEARDVEARLTQTLRIIGSPSYMAPEQAGAGDGRVGPAADVYALGAILYEVITGRPPFQSATILETLERVKLDEPASPASLRPGLPRDLTTICLTCLRKEPERRYAGADLLAEDLRRFAAGEPILARPSGRAERAWLWCRRRPAMASLIAAVATLMATIAVATPLAAISLRRDRDRALRAEQVAVERLRQSLLEGARANRLGGRQGQRFDGLAKLSEAAAIRPGTDLRDEAIACLTTPDLRASRQWPGLPLKEHDSLIDFSPGLDLYARAGPGGSVSVRRVSDDSEVRNLIPPGPTGRAYAQRFGPGGRHLATIYVDAGDRRPRHLVWDLADGALVLDLPTDWPSACLAFTPDRLRIAVGLPHRTIRIYDLAARREVGRWDGVPADLDLMAFDPAGRRAAITDALGRTVQVRDAITGGLLADLEHPAGTRGVAWSGDGSTLAVGCDDQLIHLWDADAAMPLRVLVGHNAPIIYLGFGPDDSLVSGSWDGTTRLWESSTGKQRVVASGLAVRLGDSGAGLGFVDPPLVGVWEVARGEALRLFRPTTPDPLPPQGALRGNSGVAFDARGGLLASAGSSGVRLWDVASGREVTRPCPNKSGAVAFRPREGSLITFGDDGLQSWPVLAGDPTPPAVPRIGPPVTLSGPPGPPINWYPASMDDSGDLVAIGDPSGQRAIVMGLGSPGGGRVELAGHPAIESIALSPDGRWVATGGPREPGLRVWDRATGGWVADPAGGPPGARNARVAFSPDGRWLSAGLQGDTRLWRTGSWELVRTIPHDRIESLPGSIAFSPDGRILAIMPSSRRIQLIEITTGRVLASLMNPEPQLIRALAFSPDGARLASATDASNVEVWDLSFLRRRLAPLKLDWGS